MRSFRLRKWVSNGRGNKQHQAPTRSRVIRDIVGPTGWVVSSAWQELDDHGEAYQNSFDRRLPPSLFVSDRDRLRASQPMPLAERCIEDWAVEDEDLPSGPSGDPTVGPSR